MTEVTDKPTLQLNDKNYIIEDLSDQARYCLLYTSPSPRDVEESRMPSSA